MSDELRDRLSRLAEDAPSESPDPATFDRRAARRRRGRRSLVAVVAAVIALGIAIPLSSLSSLGNSKPAADSGYWIRFPEELTVSTDGFNGTLELQTNLPDGTRYQSQGGEGSCCPVVKDGTIEIQTQNGSCYGLVGDTGNAEPFTETITVAPEYQYAFIGIATGNNDPGHVVQPSSVTDVLGERFENLTGDGVQPIPRGQIAQPPGNELVASYTYSWPTPQCGGEPFPLFGGPNCQPNQQQLQGDNLDQAMTEVMGAISQARMCEFWQTDLTKQAAAAHPWPAFSNEWRDWYLNPPKNFNPNGKNAASWTETQLDWKLVRREGNAYIVDVTFDGKPIVEVTLVPLPDHCPNCNPGVVPFWGVQSWTFLDR